METKTINPFIVVPLMRFLENKENEKIVETTRMNVNLSHVEHYYEIYLYDYTINGKYHAKYPCTILILSNGADIVIDIEFDVFNAVYGDIIEKINIIKIDNNEN